MCNEVPGVKQDTATMYKAYIVKHMDQIQEKPPIGKKLFYSIVIVNKQLAVKSYYGGNYLQC